MTDIYIELSRGQWAVIDDIDYEEVSKHKWSALLTREAYYAIRTVCKDGKQRSILMHRQILGILDDPTLQGDHIDGDTLNNRRTNLRAATHKQNQENRLHVAAHSTTGVHGVHFHRINGVYIAQVHHNNKSIHLGCFTTIEEADQAAQAGRAKYFTPIKASTQE